MQSAMPHNEDQSSRTIHEPVMGAEVAALLCERRPLRIVDATLGTGGHAALLLHSAPAAACLLGLDRDQQVLPLAALRLEEFGRRVIVRHANFSQLGELAHEAGFNGVDAIVADLGMSSFALDDPSRGFSFMREGPLDMRMDSSSALRADELVNEESEAELARIIYEFGEERGSRRIARAIVEARRRKPLATTAELRAVVERAIGRHRGGGVHPATRTFQALRIAVNDELGNLRALLEQGPGCLAPGGRMVVIAYHSLEDRLVKGRLRELAQGGGYSLVFRKALRPTPAEVQHNPRARSARLRCLERNP
jgi:16S rRNA (cytosine1402-N4)-methyltransferase